MNIPPRPPGTLTPISILVQSLMRDRLAAHRPLLSRHGRRLRRYDPRKIGYFFAAGKHTYFYYHGRKQQLRSSLISLQRRLVGQHFFRIHRAVLVNLAHISRVQRPSPKAPARVWLGPKRCVPVSRRARPDLWQRLGLRKRP